MVGSNEYQNMSVCQERDSQGGQDLICSVVKVEMKVVEGWQKGME